MKIKIGLPSPALVVALIALSVSLAGNAGAFSSAQKVRRGDIAPGAITSRALAKGAVKAKNLAKGAVTSKAIAAGAVGAVALGSDSVTANAIAPNSVRGYALGALSEQTASINDLDASEGNAIWTSSETASAMCGVGERLLLPGFRFTNPGNREVAPLTIMPFRSPSAEGLVGQITSNSGGSAQAEVKVFCLR